MSRACFLALLLILAAGCNGQSSNAYIGYGTITRDSEDVSLIELIANPKEFDGKLVRVKGYLNLQFEGDVLYLTQDAYRHEITSDAVYIILGSTLHDLRRATLLEPKQGYALVEGIFDAANPGHMNCCSGALKDVSRVKFDPSSSY